jgi:hypothetical protein
MVETIEEKGRRGGRLVLLGEEVVELVLLLVKVIRDRTAGREPATKECLLLASESGLLSLPLPIFQHLRVLFVVATHKASPSLDPVLLLLTGARAVTGLVSSATN